MNESVAAEIDAWPVDVRAALAKIVERIETVGLDRVYEPHVKHIEGEICEMPERPAALKVVRCT